ncbi:MAG: hypothetical protein JNK15_26045, partial [Planctomycetes bacterium]|nr:hypothetical protein [Planctomycetota bacterium]
MRTSHAPARASSPFVFAVLLSTAIGLAQSNPSAAMPNECCTEVTANLSQLGDFGLLEDAGEVRTKLDTYGTALLAVRNSRPPSGLIGMAEIYQNLFVVDGSGPAWGNTGVLLKGGGIPVPDVHAEHLVGPAAGQGALGFQPRPGNFPGNIIYEVNETYYQYGGPLETGASPQTTAVYAAEGQGFTVSYPLSNNLSGAKLFRYGTAPNEYVEVKHVDGSVAHFEQFNPYVSAWTPPSGTRLWRITWVRDPYDNQAAYTYDSANRLERIDYPNGIRQTFDYAQWAGFSGAFDCLKISFSLTAGGAVPAELSARNWGMVFAGSNGTAQGRHFGAKLFRTYSATRGVLVDATPHTPYALDANSVVQGQIVHEFSYNAQNGRLTETQRVNGSGAFVYDLLIYPIGLPPQEILETQFHLSGPDIGRTSLQTRVMTGEFVAVTYPAAERDEDILTQDDLNTMRAIEVTNATGTKRRFEFAGGSGRLYSVITKASNDVNGRPRASHVTTENNGINGNGEGVASSDIEPDTLTVYNIYSLGCVCNKPSERHLISVRNGDEKRRKTLFEYDPVSRLVTKRKEPNPEAGAGPFAPHVEWIYTYIRTNDNFTATQDWGAWLLKTEVIPDPNSPGGTATYEYTYDDWMLRTDSARHGRMAGKVERSLAGVRIQETLTGAPSTSPTAVVQTVLRNLPTLPANLPMMGYVKGMPRKVTDGDGVDTVFEYSNSGHLTAEIVGGVRSEFVIDAASNVTSTIENVGSSIPLTTTFTLELATGDVRTATTTSGVLRVSETYFDRFGHAAIERHNNLASNGNKPTHYGASPGAARDWVETHSIYHHYRLLETYVDRKPLDELAGGAQFLATEYTYGTDGRLLSTKNPNGSTTEYLFDGYGTLYRTVVKNPAGTAEVKTGKSFVSPFLEVTASYVANGSDHLWTVITRNDAGAITKIREPLADVPTGYGAYSTGGAEHRFEVDKLGRATKAQTFADGTSTTPLQVREMRYDQLDRQIWQRDQVLGAGSGDHYTAWHYKPGRLSQYEGVERTGVGKTTYVWNAMGLLTTVNSGKRTSDQAVYSATGYRYLANTAFVEFVDTTDLEPVSGYRTTSTKYDRDPFGRVTKITQFDAQAQQTQLEHFYGYNSHGRVDWYKDPAQREQWFLPDAVGRVLEHVRVGTGGSTITNTASYVDFGEADGRTKETRIDGLAYTANPQTHATTTHWDYAGRPFIVQNPGSDGMPTSSSPNKVMTLYAEYDGASRLSALYDGDFGKTEFFRDGPGRVILRRLVNSTASVDRVSQWNTIDWLRRDALGQLVENDYRGGVGYEYPMGTENFVQDSLGRVHSEKFTSAFATAHTLRTTSSWSGGNPFRAELTYDDQLTSGSSTGPSGMETAKMTFGRDEIGRLSTIEWDRAPGATGQQRSLADYGWAGGLRRTRTVHVQGGQYPQMRSEFQFDRYGRLLQLKDDFYTSSSSFTPKSQFDYEYDAASNLTKEKYAKVGGRVGDRFAYDGFHRLTQAWMGVDQATMDAANPPATFTSSQVHEYLTYGLDEANNRTSTSSLVATTPDVTTYSLQDDTHWQGASNRYNTVALPGASATFLEYDDRGNLTYDGKFKYRYDYMNRLQEVWRVIPVGEVPVDGEKYGVVQEGALDDAQKDVKLEVPDLYSRLAHEHTDPIFRARLRATITGGVIRITPTAQGGGGRPGFVPINGTLELVAVYLYDAFNRRTTSILVDPSVGETQLHTWDGWRQCSQHRVEPNAQGTWVATPTKQFVWGSRLDEMVAYRRSTASGWVNYYVVHGGQDTAAKLVDSTGLVVEQYEYDPYGRVKVFAGGGVYAASTVGLPFLWKAIRLDEITGLLQMRNRYYSVEFGRFCSGDPIGSWGDNMNAGNSYCYVGNCPLSASDPMGLFGTSDHIEITLEALKGSGL